VTPEHVVVVCDHANVRGGSSRVAIASALALAQRGVRVTLLAAVGPLEPALLDEPNLTVVLTGQNDILGEPRRWRAVLQGIWNRSAGRAMREILAYDDPRTTVVHVHGWTKALSSSVVRAAHRRGFRVALTLHDYFVACPNGSFYDHRRHEVCTLKPLSAACVMRDCDPRNYAQKLWRVARQIVQRTFGRIPSGIDTFITVSPFSRAILEPLLPRRASIVEIDNPIEAKTEPPIDPARNAAYSYVGRLSKEKAPELLATAARAAAVPATFIGAGESDSDVRERLPGAEITGWLSSEGVSSKLREARALVFPSVWYENAPLAVREAAAMGIPAIVSDACAARDAIVPGESGLLFRSGDSASLQEAIVRCGDDALVRRLGAEAYRRFWADPPAMGRHVDGLLELYRRVVASP
jgi:glycosyltransferase involved in cell wall biosynthesis